MSDLLPVSGHVFHVVPPWRDTFTHDCDGVTYYLIGGEGEPWTCTSTATVVSTHPTLYRTADEAFTATFRQAVAV